LIRNFILRITGFSGLNLLGTTPIYFLSLLDSFALFVGYKYKWAIAAFFLSYYIELLDKTTYLNHYYFITIISLVLLFFTSKLLFFSGCFKDEKSDLKGPRWNIDILKLLLAIVYFYAGLAKLNSDWLLEDAS
jgi:hypothetical protein